jgi:hypothetical protein
LSNKSFVPEPQQRFEMHSISEKFACDKYASEVAFALQEAVEGTMRTLSFGASPLERHRSASGLLEGDNRRQ